MSRSIVWFKQFKRIPHASVFLCSYTLRHSWCIACYAPLLRVQFDMSHSMFSSYHAPSPERQYTNMGAELENVQKFKRPTNLFCHLWA